MIKRQLQDYIADVAKQLPVVALLGPRQSGKTTLAQAMFANHTYISLENLDMRMLAQNDPRAFLENYQNEHGIILDEFQHVPSILSYIQTYVDKHKVKGYFVLTGSQNFLVNQAITQTLAGRIAILTLLPFSVSELEDAALLPATIEEAVFKGMYPRVYADNVSPLIFYPGYTLTYLERDVRQISNVTDLTIFKRFVQLCAGRTGQLLNVASLASDCGISAQTAKAWLSVLEASYIIFLLQPHYKNFSKRLVKTPKLYFYDTGLACSLLGIESKEQVASHYLRGGLVESFVIAELTKLYYNSARLPRLYFWRDNHGNEVDCIIEKGNQLIPIEIKAGKTIAHDYFNGLRYWSDLAEAAEQVGYVVYAGDEDFKGSKGTILSWKHVKKVL
jgi:predicted AAA+ superfamily ATPase